MKNLFFYLVLIILISSCDCFQHANGYVFDYNTKKPLTDVSFGTKELNLSDFTDSTGYFQYSAISGGLWGCPDLKLYFTKEGYKTYKQNFKNCFSSDTIYLTKTK